MSEDDRIWDEGVSQTEHSAASYMKHKLHHNWCGYVQNLLSYEHNTKP